MQRKKTHSLLVFFLLFLGTAHHAYALTPLYGTEWEFTNDYVYSDPDDTLEGGFTNPASERAVEMRDLMVSEMRRRCPDCKFKKHINAYGFTDMKVTFPSMDNWYVIVSTDPACIEVQTKPLTLAEFRRHGPRIQRLVFDAATAVGLKVKYDGSAAHIHIGIAETFGENLKFFRNFVVDFMNHPELASGVLANDHANAPPLAALKAKQKAAFDRVIRQVDRGEITTIDEFKDALNEKVYTETVEDWGPAEKYQALNVNHEMTAEVRSIDMPENVPAFIGTLELLEARLTHVEKMTDAIAYDSKPPAEFDDIELAKRFVSYLEEMDASVEKFTKLFRVRLPKPRRLKQEIGKEAEEFSPSQAKQEVLEASPAEESPDLAKQKKAYSLLAQLLNNARVPSMRTWVRSWFTGADAREDALKASIDTNAGMIAKIMARHRKASGPVLDVIIRRLEKLVAIKHTSENARERSKYLATIAYKLVRLREMTLAEIPFYRDEDLSQVRPTEIQCSLLFNNFQTTHLKTSL